jgi:hypothetical protein
VKWLDVRSGRPGYVLPAHRRAGVYESPDSLSTSSRDFLIRFRRIGLGYCPVTTGLVLSQEGDKGSATQSIPTERSSVATAGPGMGCAACLDFMEICEGDSPGIRTRNLRIKRMRGVSIRLYHPIVSSLQLALFAWDFREYHATS